MKFKIFTQSIATLLLTVNYALAADFPCPAEGKTAKETSKNANSWVEFKEKVDRSKESIVDFYDGKPENKALLKPDSISPEKRTWKLPQSLVWQVCRYPEQKLSLTKRLQRGLQSCELTYYKKAQHIIQSLQCE